MKKPLLITFWALAVFFILVLCQFYISVFRDLLEGSELFLLPLLIFSLLGAVLLVLTLKEKIRERIGKFLFLTGAAAVGFFVAVLLHNLFYALAVIVQDITILKYIFEGLHVFFFFVAIPICPLAFLIGMIGSIVLLIKKRSLRIKNSKT